MKKLEIVASCLVTVCMCIFMLLYMTKLLEKKDSVIKNKDFFVQEAYFDVLFMGTSRVINGIFPMELWNDYGIVSYNFGGHSNELATTYWVMENTLDYTTPKLMVIDCFGLESNIKTSNNFSYVHYSLDSFPLSVTKIRTILDLMDDTVMKERRASGNLDDTIMSIPRTKGEMLWDFSVYHSRWNELTEKDFSKEASKEKGAESRIAVVPQVNERIDFSRKLEDETVGIRYLRKMIEDCQDRDIEILLIYLPLPVSENRQLAANTAYDIANEYGINYINFLDMNIINFDTDCYDLQHLNPSGARKVTDYLGKYIMENYNVADQRGNDIYSGWYDDYEEYTQLKISNLNKQESLEQYLMLLADKNYDVLIEVFDEDILTDVKYISLFKNLGINYNCIDKNVNILTIQAGGKSVGYLTFDLSTIILNSPIGNLSFCLEEDTYQYEDIAGCYDVYLNGNILYTASPEEAAHIRIAVIDNKTGKVINLKTY